MNKQSSTVKKKSVGFIITDILYLCMMILPIVLGIAVSVITSPASDGIAISGALIYAEIPMPVQPLVITESQINSWLVMITIAGLCLYLTHGLKTRIELKRQYLAEWVVEAVDKLVSGTMGNNFGSFPPFIASIIALSAFSSLLSLVGLYPPTSDINVVAGWALLSFTLILYYKLKCGPWHYAKSLASPIALTPLNVIGEVATPVSMAFRHYGNVLSGSVISVLIAAGLQGLSSIVLGWIPGFEFPLLQIGIPGILSIYFDVFSGCLQAYIFAMLTMMYISDGFDSEEYYKRKQKKLQKKLQKSKN